MFILAPGSFQPEVRSKCSVSGIRIESNSSKGDSLLFFQIFRAAAGEHAFICDELKDA